MARGIGAALVGLSLVVGIGIRSTAAQDAANVADSLPPLPQSGFGIPAPTAPAPPTVGSAPPRAPSLRLPAPGAGVTPLQQSDPNAPAFLIRPRVTIAETLSDNVRATASGRTGDLESRFAPGLSVSADTPRLQAVLNADFDVYKYVFATDQNRELLNLYGSGTATAVPDTLFVDLKSSITQGSLVGGLGFAPVAQQPKNQTTQIVSTAVSPYLRKSYDGLVDSELRYSFATINSGGTGLAPITAASQNPSTALSDSTINEGTLTVATGRDFQRLLSRVTIDASNLDTSSLARNTSLTAYNDLQYRLTPTIAALGRIGYENIRFPAVPSATTVGPAWQIGGRVDFAADTDFAIVRYGKLQGIYGFSGALRYEITPATVLTAEASQSLTSQQQQITSSLFASQLDPTTGQVVDQYDLPTAIVNPNFAVQNEVSRSKRYSLNLSTTVEPNHFLVFGTYERRTSLSATTPTATSIGIHFDWLRDIRPNLTGRIGFGYTISSDLSVFAPTNPTVITTVSNTDMISGDLSLIYLFNDNLIGSILYNIYYQSNRPSLTASNTIAIGNILTNRLTFSLTKTF